MSDPVSTAADSRDQPTDAAAAVFRVVRGNPTAEELAAVTAVVTAALEDDAEEAAEAGHQSAWQRSQRDIRTPLVRGPGTWRGF